jgi:hypothetical protein
MNLDEPDCDCRWWPKLRRSGSIDTEVRLVNGPVTQSRSGTMVEPSSTIRI